MRPVDPMIEDLELRVYAKDQPEYLPLPARVDSTGTVVTRFTDMPLQRTRRLISLWEIMKPLLAENIASIFAYLSQITQVASTSPSAEEVPVPWRQRFANEFLVVIQQLCADLFLPESMEATLRLQKSLLQDNSVTNAELHHRFDCLRELLQSEMRKHLYLQVPDELAGYYQNARPFGEDVFNAFPTARFDITEAATCLACGNNTAAGFHLMRAAEIGLWELATDRQIELYKNGKLKFSEWGLIIGELEVAVREIRNWPASQSKEEAYRFFNSTLIEIRAFNDGWRRHIAHVRENQQELYDEDALSLSAHVRRFLEKLATKISEGRYTTLVWSP